MPPNETPFGRQGKTREQNSETFGLKRKITTMTKSHYWRAADNMDIIVPESYIFTNQRSHSYCGYK